MPTATTFNIALPADLLVFVEAQAQAGGYNAISDYVRELICEAQKQAEQLEFEKLLLEGLDSPRMDEKEVFNYLRQQMEERRQKRAHQQTRQLTNEIPR